MLKYVNKKQNYYKLFNINTRIVKTASSEQYTLYHLLLKKHYKLYTGEVSFVSTVNTVLNLHKPFKSFFITRKPKSYPFKVLKT